MIKLSQRDNRALEQKARSDLKHLREALKKEPVVQRFFKKYDRDINEIDDVSVQFVNDLDVSAKTIDGKIYLNSEMLEENWKDYMHYMVHELEHYCQHRSNKCVENSNETNYLDNPAEVEAFKAQLKYRQKTEPKKEVDQYVTQLFDKHEIPKKERPEKKRELLGRK